MPLATSPVFGQGYSPTAPTEWAYLNATVRGQLGQRPPLVYCHGSGGTATNLLTNAIERALVDGLAQRYCVIAADLGLQAWGNDRHVQAISEAIAYLETTWGATQRVTLVAGSMGNLGALGYVRQNPGKVRAYAGVLPALDLASLHAMPALTAEINGVYPPAYDDVSMGPTHSPVQYAATLDSDLPIRLWTASNDTITLPSTASAFVAARPQTERIDLGALDHSPAAVAAATPLILDWLATT